MEAYWPIKLAYNLLRPNTLIWAACTLKLSSLPLCCSAPAQAFFVSSQTLLITTSRCCRGRVPHPNSSRFLHFHMFLIVMAIFSGHRLSLVVLLCKLKHLCIQSFKGNVKNPWLNNEGHELTQTSFAARQSLIACIVTMS